MQFYNKIKGSVGPEQVRGTWLSTKPILPSQFCGRWESVDIIYIVINGWLEYFKIYSVEKLQVSDSLVLFHSE